LTTHKLFHDDFAAGTEQLTIPPIEGFNPSDTEIFASIVSMTLSKIVTERPSAVLLAHCFDLLAASHPYHTSGLLSLDLHAIFLSSSQGLKPDSTPSRRISSRLIWAARHGHAEVVKMLLAAGADIEAKYSDVSNGRTPLGLAAEWGHANVVKLLLDAGGKSDTPGGLLGQTPLSVAAARAHTEVV
jgi:hypothetical protein